MKRAILTTITAGLLTIAGGAAIANADGGTLPPPTVTPATTCMNCK